MNALLNEPQTFAAGAPLGKGRSLEERDAMCLLLSCPFSKIFERARAEMKHVNMCLHFHMPLVGKRPKNLE